MTDFEAQLIRVIENGCPFCGSDNIWLQQLWLMEKEVVVKRDTEGQYIDYAYYDEWEDVDEHNNSVFCKECGKRILWRDEKGWIPELAEIVKGDK